jgi:cystathionine beta-synthase
MFNDYWMFDQGLIDRPSEGNLKDLVGRRHEEGGAITAAPDDTLLAVYRRMKLYEVSQLPILEGGELVGIIDESDLLMKIATSPENFALPAREAMTRGVETIPVTAPLDDLLPIFARDRVAVVEADGAFYGLITRIDLLNHLRQKVAS